MDCYSQQKRMIIVKGDDTGFNNKKFISINISSQTLNLQTLTAKLELCGVTKAFTDLTQELVVNYTALETSTFPLGNQNGILRFFDSQSRRETLTSVLPFKVIGIVTKGMEITNEYTLNFDIKDNYSYTLDIEVTANITDHNSLLGREDPNCHSVGAITGLQSLLDSKQDVIEDLSTIRAGAALGATALQPSALNNTTLTGNTTAEALKIGGHDALTTNSTLDGGKLSTGSVSKTALATSVQASLDKADTAVQTITTGTDNGTISVDGTDVSVKGLGSAAFTDSTEYDAAGAASTAETNAKNYADGVASTAETNAKNYADGLSVNYATAAQGQKADTAVQTIQTGTANGTINVDGSDVAVKGLGTAAYTPSSDYATAAQGITADSALQPEDVIDNVASTSVTKPLSANMGKSLQDQIDNLKQRGHFLSLWNCATGLAQSNPPQSPYTYQAGDFFIIGTVAAEGSTNYRPDGSSYTTGVASTTVETEAVDENDVYWYDGTNWLLQINTQKEVTFGSVAGDPYDNSNLASALNAKQDELTQGTGIDITSNTISNSGVRSVATGTTDGTIAVNTGGTSAEVAVAGLGSAAFKAAASFATSAQGTKADTAIQDVRTGTTNGTLAVDGADVAVKGLGSAAYTPSTDYATSSQGAKADTALQNIATGTNGLTIAGTASTNQGATNVGYSSLAATSGATSFGYNARAWYGSSLAMGANSNAGPTYSIAIGAAAATQTGKGAIQIGRGTNSEAGTLCIGSTTDGENFTNYKLLDSDGTIPVGRLPNAITSTQVTIATTDWSSNTCTKNITGVTATSDVFVAPAPTLANIKAYSEANVFCSAIGSGTVTFTCETTPTTSLTVNIGVN